MKVTVPQTPTPQRAGGPLCCNLIEQEFTVPIKSMVTSLVTHALGLEEGDERAQLRALLILGQLWVVHEGADRTLGDLGWPDFAGDRLTAGVGPRRCRAPSVQTVEVQLLARS
jgi:hypothetical protein